MEDKTFAGTHAGPDAVLGPLGVEDRHEIANVSGREALARLAGLTHQHPEQVGEMPVLADQAIWSAADRVAAIGQELDLQRDRVGFGLWCHRANDLADEAVIGGDVEDRPRVRCRDQCPRQLRPEPALPVRGSCRASDRVQILPQRTRS